MEAEIRPRIYLVDDDGSVRKALRRLLASAGHDVAAFASAHDFLDQVPLDTEGVLVLDLRMPGMDGFELLRRIGRSHPGTDVILMTGYASVDGAMCPPRTMPARLSGQAPSW